MADIDIDAIDEKRLKKLPKWGQELIEALRSRIDDLDEEEAAFDAILADLWTAIAIKRASFAADVPGADRAFRAARLLRAPLDRN